jgi:hypothetical protein
LHALNRPARKGRLAEGGDDHSCGDDLG